MQERELELVPRETARDTKQQLTAEELPHNDNYERMVVAGVVFETDSGEALRRLKLLDEEKGLFYRVVNRKLVEWMMKLHGEGVDPGGFMIDRTWGVLAAAVRHRDPRFWDQGAKIAVSALLDWFSPSLNFAWTMEQLVSLAVVRDRVAIAQRELQGMEGRSPEELREFWERQNHELQQGILDRRAKIKMAAMPEELLVELEAKHTRMRKGEGLTLGIPTVDRSMSGLSEGDMVQLCARAGVGKTTLVANILTYRSRPVAREVNPEAWRVVFSMDMAAVDVFEKCLMCSQGIGWRDLFRPENRDETLAEGLSYHGRTLLDNSPSLTVSEVESRVMTYRERMGGKPPELVIIDHLGDVKPSNQKLRSRYEIVSETIQGLKEAAKRLETVFLVIVQLSRKAGDGDEEVKTDHLRDSGVIEETGDLILGAWRPRKGRDSDDEMRLKVLKARRMAGVTLTMRWDPQIARVVEETTTDETPWWEGSGAAREPEDREREPGEDDAKETGVLKFPKPPF